MDTELTDWLLANYGREAMTRETGLGNITKALGPLVPELQKKKIVTIAGTNGKGETTLWLSRELGKKKHCTWISPHVERITERFSSEDGEIELSVLRRLIESCHREVEVRGLVLTYYEFLFLVFCHWVKEKDPEVILLEVGLGGRLDAVNVFSADILLLPSISRDHQEFLGNRYDLILREKLALLRKGTTLVSYLHLNYLRKRTREICQAVGAKLIDLEEGTRFPSWDFSNRNQLLAHAAFCLLKGENRFPEIVEEFSPRESFLEHRGEHLSQRGNWVFYGSHNVDGVRNLIQFLQSGNYTFSRPPYDAVLVSFSRRDPRDLRVMIRMLAGASLGRITLAGFPHPKAALPETLKALAAHEGLRFVEDPAQLVQDSFEGHRTLVAGSYYFLAHVKELLRRG